MTSVAFARVVLVGFMGSGKSTVGETVAKGLGWRFVDFDETIEGELGLSIADIFAEGGEARFRRAEKRVADRLLREHQVVLASGGGWAAQEGRLRALPPQTATIWLQVTAEEALQRTAAQEGRRPLLDRRDALQAARRLLEQRVQFYSDAMWRVDTEASTVEDVSARILRVLGGNVTATTAE